MNNGYFLILVVLVILVTIMVWNNKESYMKSNAQNYVMPDVAGRYMLEDDAYYARHFSKSIPKFKFNR
uniref:Uncharacterized protein n=1 Tax=Marseillevirus LCMAC101 TaxID=2506602 RepID=A0A481YSX8_9VIRU|nr:MAG: hypothetical protein LCMAC101_01890 [Marseillevirus LCMAC101]